MRCWCARCKALVPVVHRERWVTGESGEGIVRGACAICGLPTGEIGVYAAPGAQRRRVHALPEPPVWARTFVVRCGRRPVARSRAGRSATGSSGIELGNRPSPPGEPLRGD